MMKLAIVSALVLISFVLAFPAQDAVDPDTPQGSNHRNKDPCWPIWFGLGSAIPSDWIREQNSTDLHPHNTRHRICGWPNVIQNGTNRASPSE
uniref:Putative 8.9 kDa basic salivary peptide n=1 Tax=Culex tarsalis TaxID=7177 RepID=A0A1Q3FU55_CULTA